MKIALIGAGHIAIGTALHKAIEQITEEGHEIIEVESGEEIRDQDLDMVIVEEIVEYKLSGRDDIYWAPPSYQNSKPPGRRRGQRKGNYHWNK